MCGGPVVDGAGNVIGMTLARADRVSTLAVTYQDLRPVMEQLMTNIKVDPIMGGTGMRGNFVTFELDDLG